MAQNLKNFISENCQVHENLWRSESLTRRLRRGLIPVYKRLLVMAKRFMGATNSSQNGGSNIQKGSNRMFNAGDCVRVRPLVEIRSQLDSMNRTGGCTFIEPMARYCGREVKILRRVNRFFDEAQRKMLKTNKLVILEDCKCDGSQSVFTEGCDRMCYYFWRDEWLEPLKNEDDHRN